MLEWGLIVKKGQEMAKPIEIPPSVQKLRDDFQAEFEGQQFTAEQLHDWVMNTRPVYDDLLRAVVRNMVKTNKVVQPLDAKAGVLSYPPKQIYSCKIEERVGYLLGVGGPACKAASDSLFEYFAAEIRLGNYDSLLPKKLQTKKPVSTGLSR